MTDREPLKVYELAKELGIDSISLVDKLKGLDINVKNHMSELTDGDVEKARNVLKVGSTKVGSETATSAAKKTVTRKAAGAGATAATKTPTKTATKTATKTVAKAAAAPAPEAAPAATPAAKPVRKRATPATPKDVPTGTPAPSAAATTSAAANETSSSSSTVIRRRVLSDGATQTVTSTISTVTGTEKELKAPEMAPSAEIAVEAQAETPPTLTVTEPLISAPSATHAAEPEANKPSIKTSADGNRVETVRTEVKTEGGKTTTSVIRRTETTLTTYSLKDGLGKRPGGLRIIEQAKPDAAKPAADKAGAVGATAGKGSFKSDRDGFKFARVDKENLDRMAEEEARKRGPKAFDAVIKPEDVKFSDYRKKEMIFIRKRRRLRWAKT